MKASDLRMGNLVSLDFCGTPAIFKLNSVSGNRSTGHYVEYPGQVGVDKTSKMQPIPLTEEWLVKLGFNRSGNLNEKKFWKGDFYFSFGDYALSKFDGLHNRHVWYNHQFFYLQNESRIFYVHQLQNLYFALTGEELTIK